MVNLAIQPIFQVAIGVAILIWFFWGLHYRFTKASQYELGLLDIELPEWHEQAFWPLLILLLIILSWGMFFT